VRPDARIVNLETAVTTSPEAWPGKGIHYRMNPANMPALAAARLDCCVLANNHVMDWGRRGLTQTLQSLRAAGIRTAGAGENADEAAAPAAIGLAGGARVLVFAYAMASSGVPALWAAGPARSGVNFLDGLSERSVARIARAIARHKGERDIAVLSIHWGGNWGYEITPSERAFAHMLVDAARVDVVHGHSSHHPKAIEVYRGRPILYGCGDFLNDYEGIGGNEEFRPELCLMYFLHLEASGGLRALELVPMRVRRFRLERADDEARRWLAEMLARESARLGTVIESGRDGMLRVTA
jgi:poly-gamma-glutamate synthesis protein (capsule biosynthesis protein)